MTQVSKIKTVKRSALYHLIRTISPINRVLDARTDVLGGALAVAICVSAVFLVRMLL